VRVVREGEITENVLLEMNQPGFEEMGKHIAQQPDPERWETVQEMMLKEALQRGFKAGAARMCGKIAEGLDESLREEFSVSCGALLNEVLLELLEANRPLSISIGKASEKDEP